MASRRHGQWRSHFTRARQAEGEGEEWGEGPAVNSGTRPSLQGRIGISRCCGPRGGPRRAWRAADSTTWRPQGSAPQRAPSTVVLPPAQGLAQCPYVREAHPSPRAAQKGEEGPLGGDGCLRLLHTRAQRQGGCCPRGAHPGSPRQAPGLPAGTLPAASTQERQSRSEEASRAGLGSAGQAT